MLASALSALICESVTGVFRGSTATVSTTTQAASLLVEMIDRLPALPAGDHNIPSQRSRDQLILLEKVGRFWVQGVLARAAEQAGLIQLTRQPYDQAVANPWHDSVGRAYYQDQTPLTDGSIEAIYHSADRALLILGDAGAGKTTTLIALAKHLLAAAGQDDGRPIPVILNLASWAEKQPPVKQWVVSELQAKYQIPRTLGQSWLDDSNLALLLDGLDELPAERQPECIAAINRFREEHGLTGIVVCSRLVY
jgi:hypothetical protein